MDPNTLRLVLTLVPAVTELAGQVLEIASRLQASGYEIPTKEQLEAANDKLRALSDL